MDANELEAYLELIGMVVFLTTKCPGCGSSSCHVYSTSKPVRYHACNVCGKKFQSIEIELDD